MRTWMMRQHFDGHRIGHRVLLVGDVAKMLLMVRFRLENIVFNNCIAIHSRCKGNPNRVNVLLTAY